MMVAVVAAAVVALLYKMDPLYFVAGGGGGAGGRINATRCRCKYYDSGNHSSDGTANGGQSGQGGPGGGSTSGGRRWWWIFQVTVESVEIQPLGDFHSVTELSGGAASSTYPSIGGSVEGESLVPPVVGVGATQGCWTAPANLVDSREVGGGGILQFRNRPK